MGKRLCVRCADNRARKDHSTCIACSEEKKIKRAPDVSVALRREKATREKLALVELARAQLVRRLGAVL